jgi:transcriptional regulator with PAS, ATPase and Fis domain
VRDTVATVHSEALPAGRTPRCQLVVIEGPDAGRAQVIGRGLIVGSDRSAGLVLSDERVSHQHLEIVPDGAGWLVRDLDSTNGTHYEGSRIKEARVATGATLKVGHTFLRIQAAPEPLEVQPSQSRRLGELVAESLAMREVFAVLELAAQSEATVLLEGETGTGKELAARAIHDASPRRRGPFVAIDCGALPESLLESELFGHVRGAFTGASQGRAGAFARAAGGTIFLDELGAVTPAVQARLLRVVEERRVRPVGSDAEKELDVRIVAASRHGLEARVAEGAFRPDLYYRLSVVRVILPPLRARREDIAPIVAALLERRGFDDDPARIEGPNLEALMAHGWPGNVRELRNVVERALALSPLARTFGELRLAVTPRAAEEALAVRADLPYAEAKQALLDAFERAYVGDVLQRAGGNLSAASRLSGVDRKHLRALLKKHGLWSAPEDDEE